MLWSVAESGAPPATAQQVDVRTHLSERVTRGINPVNSWERVEDDLPPLRHLVIYASGQSDCAEPDLGAAGRPCRARVSHVIVRLCHLHEDAELEGLPGEPWAELVEEKVWRLCGSRFVGEVLRPGIGPDPKAPVAAHAAGVGELERGASEEGFAGETRGDRFWGFNEPLGIRVGGQERSHRLRPTSPEGGSGPQKFEELLPVADRETVKGMRDNVCVQVVVEMEADSDTPGAGTPGVVVRDVWQAGRVGVANCDGR